MNARAITPDLLRDLFVIDEQAGRLVWKNPPKNKVYLTGFEAGCAVPNQNGKFYWVIRINRAGFKRGRLLFLLRHGRWPSPCVDHDNGNSLDDSWGNLREATHTQNSRNRKVGKPGRSLPMGVREARGKYAARILIDRRYTHLGTYATPE